MSISVRTFNLIRDAWLPVRRKSGALQTIRPAQLVDDLENDPIIAFNWSRADFQIASLEFIIGLLATAFPPVTEEQWREKWDHPPKIDDLEEAFGRLEEAFWLDGSGPRFLQDFKKEDFSEVKSDSIERLFIEAPGGQTIKKNTDLFIHRDQTQKISFPAAAMALFTLQSWAPSGGAGNRVGIRGGGPALTFILPKEDASLWEILWANTPLGMPAQESDFKRIFPWLAPTIESKGDKAVFCDKNAHHLQCWWGMPRRIRLDFKEAEDGEVCDVMGFPTASFVSGWKQRPYGVLYKDWTGLDYGDVADVQLHPLTPRYRQKEGEPYLSIHPQSERIGYRHWAGLVIGKGENRLPASVVALWESRQLVLRKNERRMRLLVAGYIMDNMKACNFVENYMPLLAVLEDKDMQKSVDNFACQMIDAAGLVLSEVRRHMRNALFGEKSKLSFDNSFFSDVQDEFWTLTEEKFYCLLKEMMEIAKEGDKKACDQLRWQWFEEIEQKAKFLFDRHVGLTSETDITKARIIAKSRRFLWGALSDNKKGGKRVRDALGLDAKIIEEGEKVA